MRVLPFAVLVAVAGAAALAAAQDSPTVTYQGADARIVGLRPTGVGLPRLGAGGTVGAGDLARALRAYHDSGAYAADVEAVVARARAYLTQRIDQAAAPVVQVCRKRYVRLARKRGRPLYRRAQVCTVRSQRGFTGKPAIVLDVDETALSSYDSLVAAGFTAGGLAFPAAFGSAAVMQPTLDLFNAAKAEEIAVFFIAGLPEAVSGPTRSNLERAGYRGWTGLSFRPRGTGMLAYKSQQRARIERQGYDIVLNLGDQESDLGGGHADRAFKLPNPFYFIGD